jgi:uncharacterized membrane protein
MKRNIAVLAFLGAAVMVGADVLAHAQATGGSFGGGEWGGPGRGHASSRGSRGGEWVDDGDGGLGLFFALVRILLVSLGPVPTVVILALVAVGFVILQSSRRGYDTGYGRTPGPRSPLWIHVDITALRIVVAETHRLSVQAQLTEIRRRTDVRTEEGLRRVLVAAADTLLGARNAWTHASVLNFHPMSSAEAERYFRALSRASRAGVESTAIARAPAPRRAPRTGAGPLVVTLLVAARRELMDIPVVHAEAIAAALQALRALDAADLVALELAWWPSAEHERIDERDLAARFPHLVRL